MRKPILLVAFGLIVFVALLFFIKVTQIQAMVTQGERAVPPPETVTTAPVRTQSWDVTLSAVGSLAAVNGVTIAAELPGKVIQIAFQPGAPVKKGDLLIRQDTSSEEAQLPGAVAQATETKKALERNTKLLKQRLISRADYDAVQANYQQAKAQADNLRATIAKKNIRAPFSGRVGIRQANLGQLLREGDAIVTLQSLSPIFVNFSLPQQEVEQVHAGLPVRVTCDCLSGPDIRGQITAVNPLVDADTRHVQLQATVVNEEEALRPGMFVNVDVQLPTRQEVLSIPATAVLSAPYGDSIFLVVEDAKTKEKIVRQQFVRLGKRLGDFVAVTGGLHEGEDVVSTGVFKLHNGQAVVVDNRLAPQFQKTPSPPNN